MSEPVSFATFEKVRAERDRLADRSARDRELLVMVTVERDRLRALVREAMQKAVEDDAEDHWCGWHRRARSLIRETGNG